MSKYLLSAFQNSEGYLIKSQMLRDIEIGNEHTVPPKYLSERELIIDNIQRVAHTVGFLSSKYVGVDEIDMKKYPIDEDDYNDDLLDGKIHCSECVGINFPYNSVMYHKDNEWKFQLIIQEFQIKYMILARQFHNLPNVFNIKRSSGQIQKAKLGKNSGLVLRKSKTNKDTKPYFYVKVFYYEDINKEINDDIIDGNIDFYKDVKLDSIIELNPEIKELNIDINLYKNVNKDDCDKEIINYFNNKYKEWFDEEIKPELILLEDRIKIDINFT